MPAGRPRKPDAIKAAQGTLRQDRIQEDEMRVAVMESLPIAPEILGEDGQREWHSACNALLELGMLHRVDLNALLAYCIEVDTYYEAAREIRATGLVVTESRREDTSITKANPAIQIRNTAFKNMMVIAAQFGFTPAARTRIKMETTKPEGPDAFDRAMYIDPEKAEALRLRMRNYCEADPQ